MSEIQSSNIQSSQQYPIPVDPKPELIKVISPTEVEYTFNIEKSNTFIVVGGTISPPLEFTIIPDDGSKYVYDTTYYDTDELGDEYKEDVYQGDEENLFKLMPGDPIPVIDTDSLNSLKGYDPENPNDVLSTDSNSKYPISKDKDSNIKSIIKAAKSAGISNKYSICAILAIISKESGFIPKSEVSYSNTKSSNIRKIFYGFRQMSDAEIDNIKKDPIKFFNIAYGPTAPSTSKYGNGPNDGYKYRGRGFNQITFKGTYDKYAKETGLNLVNDPDLLNTVDAAAKCAISFFKNSINSAPSDMKNRYNFTNINSFTTLDNATAAIYHANAGWGNSYNTIISDVTGGRAKAFKNAGPLYNSYAPFIT